MVANLGTTNLLLGVMAMVSVLEGFLIIGFGAACWTMYRHVMRLVAGLEERQIEPLMRQVHAILDDVKDVTVKVKAETDRMDHAIRATIDRVDDTADRVRSNVRAKTSRIVGIVRGARIALESILNTRPRPPAGAAGRA